jgi:hypothetical protein
MEQHPGFLWLRQAAQPDDPFAILGLDPSASIAEVYAARRDLARRWHPDLGGDVQQMAKINDAVRRCVKAIQLTPTPGTSPQSTRGYRNSDQTGSDSTTRDAYDITVEEEAFVDHPSFRVEALPAEAHEALRIVSSWLGEVVVDEPPYLLECLFHEPVPCWCQFHLLPEAGSSMVGGAGRRRGRKRTTIGSIGERFRHRRP